MIKIIHCADVHLGSKINARLPDEKVKMRRAEVLVTFQRMVEYAKANGVRAIVLSGDVFDSDRPIKKDKDAFYHVVKNNPDIDFLYLRGNHDGGQTYEESFDNLKLFSDEWVTYTYGDVNISGVEMTSTNASSLYSSLKLAADKINLVALHGQVDKTDGVDRVNLSKLRDKNIDYLALGHVHTYEKGRLDKRGEYAYSGCLEGRGFDDIGEKGFVLLTIDGSVSSQFIPFAKRKIVEIPVDISGLTDHFVSCDTACAKVRADKTCTKDDLVLVKVCGEIAFDGQELAGDIQKRLEGEYFFVDVKDKTRPIFDVSKYETDKSLLGEFVRTVFADESIPPELKSRVITAGRKALEGKEVD